MWRRVLAWFGFAPAAPAVHIHVPRIPNKTPPVPALPPGWRVIDDRQEIWVCYHKNKAVSWGLNRQQAMDRVWAWVKYDQAEFVSVDAVQAWVRRGETLIFVSLLGLSLMPPEQPKRSEKTTPRMEAA